MVRREEIPVNWYDWIEVYELLDEDDKQELTAQLYCAALRTRSLRIFKYITGGNIVSFFFRVTLVVLLLVLEVHDPVIAFFWGVIIALCAGLVDYYAHGRQWIDSRYQL